VGEKSRENLEQPSNLRAADFGGTFIAGKKPGSCCWWDIKYSQRQESSIRVLRHSGNGGDIMGHKHSATGSS